MRKKSLVGWTYKGIFLNYSGSFMDKRNQTVFHPTIFKVKKNFQATQEKIKVRITIEEVK